jgi:hypothetical protein
MVEDLLLLRSPMSHIIAKPNGNSAPPAGHHVVLTDDTVGRATPVGKFQTSKVPLFLLSLKASSPGVNLAAADTVIVREAQPRSSRRREVAPCEDRSTDAGERFFGRSARSRFAERKAMIDRECELPITKQAQLLRVAAVSTICHVQCRRATWR